MANKRRPWSGHDDELLRRLWESGVSSAVIRDKLRRNWTRVYERARELNLKRPENCTTLHGPRPWTSEDDESIRRMHAEGIPLARMGAVIGRHWMAVKARLLQIGALTGTKTAKLHRCLFHIHGCKQIVDRSRGEWICPRCKESQSGYVELNGRVVR